MRILIAVLMVLLLTSCSDVKDLKFTEDNQDQVMEEVRKSKDLTGEEVGLLVTSLARTSFLGGGLEGKTVGKLIEEQRKIASDAEAEEKEAKRVAEEAAKKEAQVAADLSKHILVAPFKKSFHEGDWHDTIAIDFVFENKSDKDIKAFKGVTVFKSWSGKTGQVHKCKNCSIMNEKRSDYEQETEKKSCTGIQGESGVGCPEGRSDDR